MNFIGIYYRDSIYDMLKQKKHMCKNITKKKLTKKKLWTSEWPKMSQPSLGLATKAKGACKGANQK